MKGCTMQVHLVRRFALIACVSAWTFAQTAPAAPQSNEGQDAKALLVELEALSAQITEKVDVEAALVRTREVSKRLIALGKEALPLIQERLADRSRPEFRRDLAYIVGEIPGEDADRELVRLLCFDKSPVAGTALFQLLHRRDRQGPFTFPLAEEELDLLVEAVKDGSGGGSIIRLLGMCTQNDVKARFDPILARYISDIHYDGEFLEIKDTYLSPRTFMLNGYLLAFRYMGDTAWAPLRAAIQEARDQNDAEVEKWLCMAAGFAGDPEVADRLEPVALSDPDRYVRLLAIRAYASSAGQKALPVLESLLDDTTVGEYDNKEFAPPRKIIAGTARAEISRLKSKLD